MISEKEFFLQKILDCSDVYFSENVVKYTLKLMEKTNIYTWKAKEANHIKIEGFKRGYATS